jgi:hypothetical protein
VVQTLPVSPELAQQLSGDWTYRSLKNIPDPVGDFNQIRFAETDLALTVAADGSLRGTLSFPAGAPEAERGYMDLEGRVWGTEPVRVRFTGRGREGTRSWNFEYAYDGIVSPAMPGANAQRLALVGTVMRVRDRPEGPVPSMVGVTASFVAVRRG